MVDCLPLEPVTRTAPWLPDNFEQQIRSAYLPRTRNQFAQRLPEPCTNDIGNQQPVFVVELCTTPNHAVWIGSDGIRYCVAGQTGSARAYDPQLVEAAEEPQHIIRILVRSSFEVVYCNGLQDAIQQHRMNAVIAEFAAEL